MKMYAAPVLEIHASIGSHAGAHHRSINRDEQIAVLAEAIGCADQGKPICELHPNGPILARHNNGAQVLHRRRCNGVLTVTIRSVVGLNVTAKKGWVR